MKALADIRTALNLVMAPIRGETHQDRLESFYQGQASNYDQFRNRLLKGRQELLIHPGVRHEGIWLDMGGGTGANLEMVSDISRFQAIHVVDLAPSLIDIAKRRIEAKGWSNVTTHMADATTFASSRPASLVTFSYSLSMIPNWFAAIDQAYKLLAPGGQIAVVDFFVSEKYAGGSRVRHSWWTRNFWPMWFAADNVNLSSEIVSYLHYRFLVERYEELETRMPFLGFLGGVPYFLFYWEEGGVGQMA